MVDWLNQSSNVKSGLALAAGHAASSLDASHVFHPRALYITDLTGIGFDGMKVRARPVNGGPEVVLGTEIRGLVQSATSSKIVFVEQRPTYEYDVKVVDLAKGIAPAVLIDDVESATAQGDTAYVGVGEQGLYAIALP